MLARFNLRLTPDLTLKLLLGLRVIFVLAQLVVLALALWLFQMQLPVAWLLAAVALLAASCLLLAWRLSRGWPVTELEVGLQLLVDIAELTWLLYLAGGSANPFVSAFLVPIALAAAALRPRYNLAITLVCLAAYSLLLKFRVPLPHMHQGAMSEFGLHVVGMWVNFFLSACLIAGILWLMAEGIRRRDRQLIAAREKTLRNEQVVALGSLAAGAAHELSTPLSTVALVADELACEMADNAAVQDDLALLREQVRQCKATLATLLANTDPERIDQRRALRIDDFFDRVLDRWRLLRPEVTLAANQVEDASLRLLPEQGLAQTLINLLNNAADASLAAGHSRIELQVELQGEQLQIEIADHGQGLDEQSRAMAGQVAFSNKPDGTGLGLLLSNATLERWGGGLSLHRRPGGGTLTRISLPLPLAEDDHE